MFSHIRLELINAKGAWRKLHELPSVQALSRFSPEELKIFLLAKKAMWSVCVCVCVCVCEASMSTNIFRNFSLI
jgi:hypothetical protein